MKFDLESLLKRRSSGYRSTAMRPAPVLAIQQGDQGFDYLLARPVGERWEIEQCGQYRSPELAGDQTRAVESEESSADAADSRPRDAGGNRPPATATNIDSAPETPSTTQQALSDWQDFLSNGLTELRADLGQRLAGRRILLCLRRPVVDFFADRVLAIEGIDFCEQVHNQVAVRERIETEQYALDYAAGPANADGQRQTFISVLDRAVRDQWAAALSGHKLHLGSLAVRPWALAECARQLGPQETGDAYLLIAVYAKQADLIVMNRSLPILVRSIHLQRPDDHPAIARQLVAEIRLTASSVDLPGDPQQLNRAVLFAAPELAQVAVEQLEQELNLSSQIVDLPGGRSLQTAGPLEIPATVAPLIGTLLAHTASPDDMQLDLWNPKVPRKPPSTWKKVALAAAGVLLVLGYFGFTHWEDYQAIETEMKEMADQLKKSDDVLERTLPQARISSFVQQWEGQRVHWLEQLETLTQKLPSGDQAVVRQFDGRRSANGADISMQIQARDLETITEIDQSIGDSGWHVQFRRIVETQDPDFPFRLESTVSDTRE